MTTLNSQHETTKTNEVLAAGTPLQTKSLHDYFPKPQVNYPYIPLSQQKYLKKVFVQTWGCQMNVADTERMLALLGQLNYRKTEEVEEADLILLNTCHIREKARHKVVSRLGELKYLKEKDSSRIIAIAGCVAQAESKQLMKEVPFVDLIFGPDQIEKFPELLEEVVLRAENRRQEKDQTAGSAMSSSVPPVSEDNVEQKTSCADKGGACHDTIEPDSSSVRSISNSKKPIVLAKFDKDDEGYSIPIDVVPPYVDEESKEVSRYVNIIKGCNNFCTFCVVPYTRGREKSRAPLEIVEEVNYLVNAGAKEVVLLGQNVNSYGLDLVEKSEEFRSSFQKTALPFADLIYLVSEVPQLERIRFTTSNPHDFTEDIVHAFRDIPKLTNSFHLPVQSGSNLILDRMNRQYTREVYFERVEQIRAVRPEVAFSTDIIVGFPGETDEDFAQTMSLVEQMQYAFIYAFKYSIRKGTPAIRFRDQVPEEIKDKRLQALLELQKKETLRQNLEEVGKNREVLIYYANKKQKDTWYGRTYEGRLVKVYSSGDILGKILPIQITAANITALEGICI